jgi:hypothetical protein
MKKRLYSISLFLSLYGVIGWQLPVQAQRKVVSELTLVYDYTAGPVSKDKPGNTETAVYTVYIKGNMSRSEMSNSLFSSTSIYDANTGFGVLLKEVNGQKLLIRLNPDDWSEKNRMYDGIVFRNTAENSEVAGFRCVKAMGQTKSGATITVFYTRELVTENRQYDPIFRTLDGLPLEYELTNGDIRIHYKLSKIIQNPVPASKFDIPGSGSGYREMNYAESKKMNVGS